MLFSVFPIDITVIHGDITYKGKCPPTEDSTNDSFVINLEDFIVTTQNDNTSSVVPHKKEDTENDDFDRLYGIINELSKGDFCILNKIFKYSILNDKLFERLITKMISHKNLNAYRRIIHCLSTKNYHLATKLFAHKNARINDVFLDVLKSGRLDKGDISDEFKNTFLSHVDPVKCSSIMYNEKLHSKYACNYFKQNITLNTLMKMNRFESEMLVNYLRDISK